MDFIFGHANHILLGLLIFLGGFIDSMAGGGGLITLPAYLHFGLPVDRLLGTNKLSSGLGTAVATFKFLKELDFKKEFLLPLIALAASGSFLGAKSISLASPSLIRYLLIITLPPIALFVIAKRRFGRADHSGDLSASALLRRCLPIAFLISFYDGMLGPGTGTFYAVALTRFCGYNLVKATALSKLLNLTSSVSALITFLALGLVDIRLGLAMGTVGMCGNYLGSHIALKKGAWIIRPMLFIVSISLLIKIVWDMVK
ncbi:MAG: TSUP family transporter [Elusimicrobiota bacterium]